MLANIQARIHSMPKRKKALWLALLIASTSLTLGFVIWAFSLHGTIGFYHVNRHMRPLFILIIACGLAIPLTALLGILFQSRRPINRINLPALPVLIMSIIGIAIPIFLFGYLVIDGPYHRVGDKPPQLLLADGSGAYGVPNMTVCFWTEKASQNSLKWGTTGTCEAVQEEKPRHQHAFTLHDLHPNTEYWYQINDGQTYRFASPPVAGQPLRFAVGSDAHYGASASRNDLTGKMLQQIADPEHRFNVFFFLGDLVDLGFKDSLWLEAIEAFSPITSTVPSRPLLGNHDTLLVGLKLYEDYCYPDGMDCQTGSRLWYRIDLNDIHFLLLDLEWSAESYTASQQEWLENQLASIPPEDWTIVMGHGYYYSSGTVGYGWHWWDNQETIQRLAPLFEKYDVDLVFSGHNHILELLQKSNVTYVICGAFGGKPMPERIYVSPYSIWYRSGQYAFVDVTIDPKTATIIFRDPSYNAMETFTVAP